MKKRQRGISYTRFTMRKLILLLSLVTPLFAQHPEDTTPDRPPSIVYDQTMHPFDTTRSDPNNWSETELAALGTAVHDASRECERLERPSGPALCSRVRQACCLGRPSQRGGAVR